MTRLNKLMLSKLFDTVHSDKAHMIALSILTIMVSFDKICHKAYPCNAISIKLSAKSNKHQSKSYRTTIQMRMSYIVDFVFFLEIIMELTTS